MLLVSTGNLPENPVSQVTEVLSHEKQQTMPRMTFIILDGSKVDVDAPEGSSVLEIARANDIDIEGACEGSLACSTCHVIVAPADFARLAAASEDEEDMLDLAFGLTATSRLGCQIIMAEALDGLTVSLPAETYNMMDE